MSIKVESLVGLYERDGEKLNATPAEHMAVRSHWNWSFFIVLEIDGHSVTVVADDLRAAITNALNRGAA